MTKCSRAIESGMQIKCLLFGRCLPQVGDVHAVELRTCRNQVVIVENLHADEDITEVSSRRGIRSQCMLDLSLCGEIALQQHLLQPEAGPTVEFRCSDLSVKAGEVSAGSSAGPRAFRSLRLLAIMRPPGARDGRRQGVGAAALMEPSATGRLHPQEGCLFAKCILGSQVDRLHPLAARVRETSSEIPSRRDSAS